MIVKKKRTDKANIDYSVAGEIPPVEMAWADMKKRLDDEMPVASNFWWASGLALLLISGLWLYTFLYRDLPAGTSVRPAGHVNTTNSKNLPGIQHAVEAGAEQDQTRAKNADDQFTIADASNNTNALRLGITEKNKRKNGRQYSNSDPCNQ